MGTGTFSDQTVENQSIMRGPCAEGYHVPTSAEWRSAALALVVVDTTTECIDEDEDTGECYEYEEYNDYDYTALRTTLKIPYAGVRYTWGDLTAQGQ
jgi:formylglycine-generating enzyme required for sulfatase activity